MAFKHILAATDFSETGDAAVRRAVALADESGAQLTLVHTIEPLPAPSPLYAHYEVTATLERLAHVRKQAAIALDAVLTPKLRERGAKVLVRDGDPVEEILAAAKEVDADLIVVATHGRRGVRRVLLGSVVETLVRTADRSVLVTR